MLESSIEELAESIRKSQMFFIPGGFSMSDEPDGSAKFIANVLRNEFQAQSNICSMKMDKMDLFSEFATVSKHLLKLDFFRMERL